MDIKDVVLKPIDNSQIDNNPKAEKPEGDSFADILKKSLDEVNKLQNKADESIKDIASGKMENIQDAVMAIEKADVSLKLLTEIRNKAIEAYKEVMRMQV
ncbi:flagellar hook-basal body complex protein FliE [Hippea maritima]|uniref:Flagellar hook-basal body complex protein FliE n=1 Tax=Hippea maritima (strain ATCC 700847 / DSM 10411 / MH2) TaxID=760142 RepID=F2LWY0_HIPMA|nr:flagellar hook-basal body complex protein FliE [Hippea maritima]AEA34164.1 Flagellar hook-basal body complex protein fliE [Hippea maritima DSM 10411]